MLTALVALVIGQEISTAQGLPIKVTELEFPIFAGFQEFVLGVKKQDSHNMGVYVNQLEAGSYGDKTPINYHDVRTGTTSWSVGAGVFGSDSCLVISCDASRNQAYTYRKTIYGLKHKGSRTWYVTGDGKLLGETCDLEMATGHWTMDVTYGKDDYTITSTAPGRGKRTLTVNPGCGIEALTIDPFKPMLKPDPTGKAAEVLVKSKEFYLLDPVTGGPVKYKAEVFGSFSGERQDAGRNGLQVEFTHGSEKESVWITHAGAWIKSTMKLGLYMLADEMPK